VPSNRGDAFLQAARARLLTVSGLPATRAWQNQRATPAPTAAWVEDALVRWDTSRRELGPGAWARSELTYRVVLRAPVGTDAHDLFALSQRVGDAFRASPLTVEGAPCETLDVRIGPPVPEPQWLALPIALVLRFDHA
jgi:hypothetical protein